MLLFAIPVCDLCKATAQYGKETDKRWWRTLECNGLPQVKAWVRKSTLKIKSQLLLNGLLGSHCGADVRRFLGNANCYEAQAPAFRWWVP